MPVCQWSALIQNGSPGRKAQGNIIVPAAPVLAATSEKTDKRKVGQTRLKRSVPQYRRQCSPDIATLFFQVAATQAASGGAVGKILIRQCVPEHGQAAFSLMVRAASPMPFHKVVPCVCVQHCPQACCGRWVSVACPPSPIDGITPKTRKTAQPLAAFAKDWHEICNWPKNHIHHVFCANFSLKLNSVSIFIVIFAS